MIFLFSFSNLFKQSHQARYSLKKVNINFEFLTMQVIFVLKIYSVMIVNKLHHFCIRALLSLFILPSHNIMLI